MRTSLYRFMKKGTKELAKMLLKAGFDGKQNGTGHIQFEHPVTHLKIAVPVNLNPKSHLKNGVEKVIKQSNEMLKDMK